METACILLTNNLLLRGTGFSAGNSFRTAARQCFEWKEAGGPRVPASVIMWGWGYEGAHMYSPESNRQGYMNVAGLLSQCLEIKPQSAILIIIQLD